MDGWMKMELHNSNEENGWIRQMEIRQFKWKDCDWAKRQENPYGGMIYVYEYIRKLQSKF